MIPILYHLMSKKRDLAQFTSILQILFALFKRLRQYLSLFICIYFYLTTTFSYCTHYPWICNHFIIQINAYRISNIICSNICKCSTTAFLIPSPLSTIVASADFIPPVISIFPSLSRNVNTFVSCFPEG